MTTNNHPQIHIHITNPQPTNTPTTNNHPEVQRTTGRPHKRNTRKLNDHDLVGFNCNLPAITRREIRKFAAHHDVDLQDAINDAIIRYLALWNIHIPYGPEKP